MSVTHPPRNPPPNPRFPWVRFVILTHLHAPELRASAFFTKDDHSELDAFDP